MALLFTVGILVHNVLTLVHPDSGLVVEWPYAPKWLHYQWGERRRLLLGTRCHRGSAGKTQPQAPHPFPWVQTGRLWVLPRPQSEYTQNGWSLRWSTDSFFWHHLVINGSHALQDIFSKRTNYLMLLPGGDYILSIKLLWGGQQQRSLH